MTTQKLHQERVQSNFESYARSFDEIYGSPEKKSVIGHSLDKLLRKSMFLRFRETLKYIKLIFPQRTSPIVLSEDLIIMNFSFQPLAKE